MQGRIVSQTTAKTRLTARFNAFPFRASNFGNLALNYAISLTIPLNLQWFRAEPRPDRMVAAKVFL